MRGLQVVAVICEDRETREAAAEFARKNKLSHTILVGGSAAADRYQFDKVLPTSFWIDHRGRVVRRESGFRPEMEKEMHRTAEELLRARDADKPAPPPPRAPEPSEGNQAEKR